MHSIIRNMSFGMVLGLGLVACGDDDKATMLAPAAIEPAVSDTAAAPASDSDDIFSSMNIEKADDVVYQDEIYANWPYN
jgi:hypothetical protein